MKYTLTLILIFHFLSAQCQNIDSAQKLYSKGKYAEALEVTRKIMLHDSSAHINCLAGRIYADLDMFDSSMPYLQTALKLDNDNSYISGWSHAYLGKALLVTGDKEKAITELHAAVALNVTKNSANFALKLLGECDTTAIRNNGYKDTLGVRWIIMEGKNIIYFFQGASGLPENAIRYIAAHEAAYIKINDVFNAKLPRKLRFYVWDDPFLANLALHQPLGFTRSNQCVCHVSPVQTIGHEMTHALSYWAGGVPTTTTRRFINEGVAVAFDLNKENKMDKAKRTVSGLNIHSVKDVWSGSYLATHEVLYPLGGAFVSFLYKQSIPYQFKAFIKKQTIESAESIYGKEHFDQLITDFNKLVGLQ